jgi:hypothetical protein
MDIVLSPRSRHLVGTHAVLITFVVVAARKAMDFSQQGFVGIDLHIYRAAAQAALAGQNPWPSSAGDAPFAATPPAIVAYLPAALMPETLASAVYVVLSVTAALFVIRTLRLPLWWVLFPPIFESILVLNPDVFVIALLVAGPRVAALAIPMKTYAAVPLLLDGNRKAVATGLLLSALAGPAWIMFLGQFDAVSEKLATQSMGGLSALGTWLMVPTVLALLALRGRGASWLAVPGLWPYTQLHYSCIALPVVARSPMLAFFFSFGIPLLPPLAIVLYAAKVTLTDMSVPHRGSVPTEPQTAVTTSDGLTARAPSS